MFLENDDGTVETHSLMIFQVICWSQGQPVNTYCIVGEMLCNAAGGDRRDKGYYLGKFLIVMI